MSIVIANYQLILGISGVCHFLGAICPVILRYSEPNSDEKWPSQSKKKITNFWCSNPKFKIQIFRGSKGAPFDQFRCSQWSQVMTLGGPKRFLLRNHEKKNSHFQELHDNQRMSQISLYLLKVGNKKVLSSPHGSLNTFLVLSDGSPSVLITLRLRMQKDED